MSVLSFSPDAWLAEIFGHAVYRIDRPRGAVPGPREIAEALRSQDARSARSFYYVKAEIQDVEWVRSLLAHGFYPVDVSLTFAAQAADVLPASSIRPSTPPDVVPAQPADEPATLDVAGTSFRFSRFHLDPNVGKPLADRIKREWIANYFRGRRGEALHVAKQEGRVVGFVAVIASKEGDARVKSIDLIGVHPDHQGRGVGRGLVEFFLHHYAPRCDRLTVGTQAANLPSLQLYQSAGMRLARSQIVLHRHVPTPSGP